MAKNAILPFGMAIVGDVLSACQIPGGNTLSALAVSHIEKRRQEAASILIEEVSKGLGEGARFEEYEVDPFIEIILRFSKAVSEGAARDNLRLLAQVIVGQKKNKALDGDQFRRWCGVLEHLTRDELLLLGIGYAISKEQRSSQSDEKAENTFWQELDKRMQAGGYEAPEIVAIAASVSRTGLFVPVSAWGGMIFVPSPWLNKLAGLCDIDNLKEL